jgi:hypothetical protein
MKDKKPIGEKFECMRCGKLWGDMRAKRKKMVVCSSCQEEDAIDTRDEVVGNVIKNHMEI